MKGWRLHRKTLLPILLGVAVMAEVMDAPAMTRTEKDGLRLEVELTSEAGPSVPLKQDDTALVRIRIQSTANNEPVRYQQPGVWLDFSNQATADGRSCAERVGSYLQGGIGSKPLLDLNSYYVLLLNEDRSIAIIDPLTQFDGKTNLFGLIPLAGRGFDWVKNANDRTLFVSIPEANKIAVIDGEILKLDRHMDLSASPGRLALPPDQRLLWVGHDGRRDKHSGVSVIDAVSLKTLKFIPLSPGHHEFAFSEDSGRVLITSRDGGVATLIDARTLEVLSNIPDMGVPISLVYSASAQAFFVADAKGGRVVAINRDGSRREPPTLLKPGLGPMRMTADGRWLLLVNPVEQVLHVVDTADQKTRHALRMPARPYQIELSERYAYIRSLDSEQVTMVQLASLASDHPIVQAVAMGAKPPSMTAELPIASGMTLAPTEGALFFVSPSDNATYYYMEGMNAPASTLQAHGHQVRAVTTVNRALRETEPGVYTARMRLPAAGQLQLAIALDSPPIYQCIPFSVDAKTNSTDGPQVGLEWTESPSADGVWVKLIDPASGQGLLGVKDVSFHLMEVGGSGRAVLAANEVGNGAYGFIWPAYLRGTYYLHVSIPSRGIRPGDLPYRSFTGPALVTEPSRKE